MVYESDKKMWCITVHIIYSAKEKVDVIIREIKLSTDSYIKYISFSNSLKQERIRALQINKFNNIKLNYERLGEVGTLDVVEGRKQIQTLAETFINAQINGITLFKGIE